MLRSSASADVTRRAYRGLGFFLVALGILVFGSAGTPDYWQGSLFLLALGIPSTLITLYLMRNDPKLLERRLDAGAAAERRPSQKVIQAIASVAFIALLAVSGLDRRFGWSNVAPSVVLVADLVVVLGLVIVFAVFRENSYTSAVIEVAEGQKVVSTGPYRIVRHPMYAGAYLLVLAMPLGLGSLVALIFTLPMLGAIAWRLVDEERYLDEQLPGYSDYRRRTRYRLVPLIW